MEHNIVIVGGGPAGFFAAITAAQQSTHRIILLEKNRQLLSKVRISGGGRCNVTHACFDPGQLVKSYPRGGDELRGPLTRFQPRDTINWFENRGVQLKVEEDGRMFPTTDQSETIIHCLLKAAKDAGVEIWTECGLEQIMQMENGFLLHLTNGEELFCRRILFATGSHPKTYVLLKQLGHAIVPLVPSLFTFNIPDSPLVDLAGVSVQTVQVRLPEIAREQMGPVLLTHWGLSGPAVLKLSAWAARELYDLDYKTKVVLNWLPEQSEEEVRQILMRSKQICGMKFICGDPPVLLPKQLWKRCVQLAGVDQEKRWSHLSNKQLQAILHQLREMTFQISGKTTYKQEFVTCGGVHLKEVNFKTMESRICPGVYFAGEVLNIDGITGGFNFQNGWTTGWIAGSSICQNF